MSGAEGLPEGIKKEILTAAPSDCTKSPKEGDDVSVHYVGTLLSDGSEFDSSRKRGTPFVFKLGQGQVIQGWDLGVATMKKGEVAKFTLAPEFAYGDAGSPPTIPEKATLVFEVELISWKSEGDLFGDEGVLKSKTKDGSGWKSPKSGDEVLISLKSSAADGSVIEERSDLEYVLGSGKLGPVDKACEQALLGMKKGEEVELKCTKEYSYVDKSPDGCTISLTLKQIFETKDVSFAKDKTVMKKMVGEGEGYETAKECAKVKLQVEAATDGAAAIAGFQAKLLEFTAGNGEVCDALEFAVGDMKKGERAVLTISKASLAAEPQLGLGNVSAEPVVLTVVMQEFEKPKETYSMSEEEKMEFGAARKDVGADLFKRGRIALALQRYKKVVELFSYVDNYSEENKVKAKDLKKACELNKAACLLKLQDYQEAMKACDVVLKEERSNVKALFRRGQAQLGLKNFSECIQDCKKVLEVDPQNRDARALAKQAQAGQKEVDKQAKGLFSQMCKALGKGPIPEPGKTAPPEGFEDEAEDCEPEAPSDPATAAA